jgi:hypothetical protein
MARAPGSPTGPSSGMGTRTLQAQPRHWRSGRGLYQRSSVAPLVPRRIHVEVGLSQVAAPVGARSLSDRASLPAPRNSQAGEFTNHRGGPSWWTSENHRKWSDLSTICRWLVPTHTHTHKDTIYENGLDISSQLTRGWRLLLELKRATGTAITDAMTPAETLSENAYATYLIHVGKPAEVIKATPEEEKDSLKRNGKIE